MSEHSTILRRLIVSAALSCAPSMPTGFLLIISAAIVLSGVLPHGSQATARRSSVEAVKVAQGSCSPDSSSPEMSWPGTSPEGPTTPQAEPKTAKPGGAERLRQLLGPVPPNPATSPTVSDADLASYAYSQLVFRKVAQARKQGILKAIPGATGVAFRLGDHGEVVDAHIIGRSGVPSLDVEAIATVKRGAPYPPPPPGALRDFTITLRFEPK